jgi:hypothetical protein
MRQRIIWSEPLSHVQLAGSVQPIAPFGFLQMEIFQWLKRSLDAEQPKLTAHVQTEVLLSRSTSVLVKLIRRVNLIDAIRVRSNRFKQNFIELKIQLLPRSISLELALLLAPDYSDI